MKPCALCGQNASILVAWPTALQPLYHYTARRMRPYLAALGTMLICRRCAGNLAQREARDDT